jgi:ATP-dependent RNA helicase RhlE
MPFNQFDFNPLILKGIREMGFTRPTPVQAEAIPLILQGKDIIASAQTGTGKTAAFTLPIFQRLLNEAENKTRALVLTPTRELAVQIEEHVRGLGAHTGLRSIAIYGGVGMTPQEQALRSHVDIVAATPGRLLDHMNRGYSNFRDLKVLVLDEADRMLDMGFLPDIRRILAHLPAKRQTLLFSATMPNEILSLAHEITHHPEYVKIGRPKPAVGITQALYPVPKHLKMKLVIAIFKQIHMTSALVFTRMKVGADRLVRELKNQHIRAEIMHGDRSQAERQRALDHFKTGKAQILVATEIASRGIDIAGVSHVINFDVPESPEAYIHRIGRTARAEMTGDAFTLVTADDELFIHTIEKAIGNQLPRVLLPDFDYHELPPHQIGHAPNPEHLFHRTSPSLNPVQPGKSRVVFSSRRRRRRR